MLKVPILQYHRIISQTELVGNEDVVSLLYAVDEDLFRKEMMYLHHNGFHMILLDDLLKWLNGQSSIPRRPVILTFDDGHVSNYTHAFPILSNLGFEAEIFVTLDWVGEHSYMTWQQIQEMAAAGFSIQSHTMTHRFLTQLDERIEVYELLQSKAILEEKLGKEVKYLAIPGGKYDKTIKKLAKELGYKGVCTSKVGYNSIQTTPYCLRRLPVKLTTPFSRFCLYVDCDLTAVLLPKLHYYVARFSEKALGSTRYRSLKEKILRLKSH